jgi:hypothetical protein
MKLGLFLPQKPSTNFLEELAEQEGGKYLDALFRVAVDYADAYAYRYGPEAMLAVDMFLRLVEAGFFKLDFSLDDDQVRVEIRAWSPMERQYKLPQDFTPEEMGVAEGLQEYFTSTN